MKFLPSLKLYKKDGQEMCFFVKVLSRTRKYESEKRISYRFALDHEKIQLRVDDVLKVLKYIVPEDAYDLVGITMYDLYDIPKTLFVSGMACNNINITSFSRYDPNYLEKKDWYVLQAAWFFLSK